MALLSDMDPDSTPRSTLCCDSTVGAYKHSDPEKKGRKERRELKDRMRTSGFQVKKSVLNTNPSGETIPYKFLLHSLLGAEPDLNPGTNGA